MRGTPQRPTLHTYNVNSATHTPVTHIADLAVTATCVALILIEVAEVVIRRRRLDSIKL